MYEPKVIQIQKPRNLRGTPAGRVQIITTLAKVLGLYGIAVSVSAFVIKKRKLVRELDGTMMIPEKEIDIGLKVFSPVQQIIESENTLD